MMRKEKEREKKGVNMVSRFDGVLNDQELRYKGISE